MKITPLLVFLLFFSVNVSALTWGLKVYNGSNHLLQVKWGDAVCENNEVEPGEYVTCTKTWSDHWYGNFRIGYPELSKLSDPVPPVPQDICKGKFQYTPDLQSSYVNISYDPEHVCGLNFEKKPGFDYYIGGSYKQEPNNNAK